VIVKAAGVDSDILINYPLRISLLAETPNPPTFVISSGDAR
jgi:hypothetical protein